jgi:hypothetical protein
MKKRILTNREMNNIKTINILILALLMTVFSCGDLDEVQPRQEATADALFADQSNYVSFNAALYENLVNTGNFGSGGSPDIRGLSDEGFSGYFRLYWQMQELPTDEAVLGFENDGSVLELNRWTWGPANNFTNGMFSRWTFQVSQANLFLRESTPELVAARGVSGAVLDEMPFFRAEARWIRALSYWHGIDLFGDIPFADESFPFGSLPPQIPAEEVFEFIEAELLDIEDELYPPGEAPYGRADQGACWMLLAKLYMNAGVYTGTPRYTDALTYINRILESGAYALAPDYQFNFNTDNELFGEIIFPLIHAGLITESFGGVSTFVGHASQGGDFDNSGDLGIGGGWSGIRPLEAFVNLFPDDLALDSRAKLDNTGTGSGGADAPRDKRVQALTGGDFNENGWIVTKFTNLSSTGAPGSDGTFLDLDFPMFRLADVYLMYAECVVRGAGGDAGTALNLVNALRERAYGDASGNITSGELTLDFILDERSRELYWEMHRRPDLIRFGVYTGSARTWQFKGNNIDGGSGDDFRALYPIPQVQIAAFGGALEQNPGY